MTDSLRLNVICKDNETLRISLITRSQTTIAKLKRVIQEEFRQLHHVTLLVSVLEDSSGFILSNNSSIGQHLSNNGTLFVQTHSDKKGDDMNLPAAMTDIFLTLRYVCASTLKKIASNQISISPGDCIPEILHMGFWYCNPETVLSVCRLLTKIMTAQTVQQFNDQYMSSVDNLLLKLFSFWLIEMPRTTRMWNQICSELLLFMLQITARPYYCDIIRKHKLTEKITELSTSISVDNGIRKAAELVLHNIQRTRKSILNNQASILPQSIVGPSLEEALSLLNSNSLQDKMQALEMLSANNEALVVQASVRSNYYESLGGLLTVKNFKEKKHFKWFNQIMNRMTQVTSQQRANEAMQQHLMKKVHNWLLISPVDVHQRVYEYLVQVCKLTVASKSFDPQQACELISSPYVQFQVPVVEAVALTSQHANEESLCKLLPYIKDMIRLALKVEQLEVQRHLLETLANLTLVEQCRYEITHLKGIETFAKFLESSEKAQVQRSCAKGLLNLSTSSRQSKAKVLQMLKRVLEKMFKGGIDSVAQGYIETILKSSRH